MYSDDFEEELDYEGGNCNSENFENDMYYEVWILGYDQDELLVDEGCMLEVFSDKRSAISYAKQFVEDVEDGNIDVRDDYNISGLATSIMVRVDATTVENEYTEILDTVYSGILRLY